MLSSFASPRVTSQGTVQPADTTNFLLLVPENDFVDSLHLPVVSLVFFFIYFALMLLAYLRRRWGLLGQRELVHFRVYEYDPRNKTHTIPAIFDERQPFKKRLTFSTMNDADLGRQYGAWKMTIYPANQYHIVIIPEDGDGKRKLVYLARPENDKNDSKNWKPIGSQFIKKNSLKESTDESIKLCSTLLEITKKKLFSIIIDFKEQRTSRFSKIWIFDKLDFKKDGASFWEKVGYCCLAVSIGIHLIWFFTDLQHFLGHGGNPLYFPKYFPGFYFLPSLILIPLLMRKPPSIENLIDMFDATWKVVSLPFALLFGAKRDISMETTQ